MTRREERVKFGLGERREGKRRDLPTTGLVACGGNCTYHVGVKEREGEGQKDTLRSVLARGNRRSGEIPNASIRLQAREDSVPVTLRASSIHPPVRACVHPYHTHSSHPTRQQDASASLIPPSKKQKTTHFSSVQPCTAPAHTKIQTKKTQPSFMQCRNERNTQLPPPENPGTEARDPHMTGPIRGCFSPEDTRSFFLFTFLVLAGTFLRGGVEWSGEGNIT